MNIADFAQSYAEKTDEELLHLAEQRDQLTSEAQFALSSELARRQIEVEAPLIATRKPSLEPSSHKDDIHPVSIKTGQFIEEVLRFYGRHRWVFIQLIFPAVFLGFVAIIFTRREAWAVAPVLYPKFSFRTMLLLTTLIRASGYLTSWMVFCLSFAAISSAIEQEHAGYAVSISESYSAVREQFWPFLKLSALLFGLYVALERALATTIASLLIQFAETHPARFGWLQSNFIGYIEYSFFALVLARLALAMPAVILDDVSVTDSLFLSYKLTRGKLAILAVLLFKGIFVSYLAGMLPFWLARWIPESIVLPSWFHWALSGASILCVTVVEPVMFIGFAMLYLRTTAPEHIEAKMASA